MKYNRIIIAIIVLICIAAGLFICVFYSRRTIGSNSGYSYSIQPSSNGSDLWVISTPKITKITLSKSTKNALSYEVELQEYKKNVDEITKLEKSLEKKLVFLSNAEIDKVAKSSPDEAKRILGTRYSYSVYETCKEIAKYEEMCEQIMMSLGSSISE